MHQQYGGHAGGTNSPEDMGPADADVELELEGWSHVTKNGGSVDWKYYRPRRCVSAETIRYERVSISMATHEQGHVRNSGSTRGNAFEHPKDSVCGCAMAHVSTRVREYYSGMIARTRARLHVCVGRV